MRAARGLRRDGAVIAPVAIGNALEWYDVVLYGFLAPKIAQAFFPVARADVAMLITLGTFGAAFLSRPLGAVVLGAVADRAGRGRALTLSLALMMLGTAVTAATPGYARIGIAAPVLVVGARLLQGFAAGGEFGTATALLAEQDPARRGWLSSWQFASQGLTMILAAVAAIAVSSARVDWAWRVPFAFGLLVGPAALAIRRRLHEGREFDAGGEARPGAAELGRVLLCCALVVLCTTLSYLTLFVPLLAIRTLHVPATVAYAAPALAGAVQLGCVPVWGWVSDRTGRVAPMLAGAVLVLLLAWPLFRLLAGSPSLGTVLAVQGALAVLGAVYLGPFAALMSELLPVRMRARGMSISYGVTVACFGGLAPALLTWLVGRTGDPASPAFYLMGCALVSAAGVLVAWRIGPVRPGDAS